jgi:hypothetical protein
MWQFCHSTPQIPQEQHHWCNKVQGRCDKATGVHIGSSPCLPTLHQLIDDSILYQVNTYDQFQFILRDLTILANSDFVVDYLSDSQRTFHTLCHSVAFLLLS